MMKGPHIPSGPSSERPFPDVSEQPSLLVYLLLWKSLKISTSRQRAAVVVPSQMIRKIDTSVFEALRVSCMHLSENRPSSAESTLKPRPVVHLDGKLEKRVWC